MKNYVLEHFEAHRERVRPHLVCVDGTRLSVQASSTHYCSPKEDYGIEYDLVEVAAGPRIRSFGRGEESSVGTIYGWVPVAKVNNFIKRHGGVK